MQMLDDLTLSTREFQDLYQFCLRSGGVRDERVKLVEKVWGIESQSTCHENLEAKVREAKSELKQVVYKMWCF